LTRRFTLKELTAMIESGEIVDAKTIIGYTHWRMLLARRKKAGKRA
jgi:hypothetical protein